MKVAIYCRVSHEDRTVENQRIVLEEFAKKNDWDYKVFEEVMSTRKTRPIKQELLRLLRNNKFDRNKCSRYNTVIFLIILTESKLAKRIKEDYS